MKTTAQTGASQLNYREISVIGCLLIALVAYASLMLNDRFQLFIVYLGITIFLGFVARWFRFLHSKKAVPIVDILSYLLLFIPSAIVNVAFSKLMDKTVLSAGLSALIWLISIGLNNRSKR